MLNLSSKADKNERSLEEAVILIQQGDQQLLNEIINSYKPFIAKVVSSVCSRYIYESDDEFSIGLIAFNDAVEKFSSDHGSLFLGFAEIIIKRRVIDYIRIQAKKRHIHFDLTVPNDAESTETIILNKLSLNDFHKKEDEQLRKEEILHFKDSLTSFNISFNDLVENSLKHQDSRKNAILTAKIIVEDKELKEFLFDKKRLPIKQLEKQVNISKKTLGRNRKYIIAIALILSGDYLFLKDHIMGMLDE
ncbi:RNA polymerase sigma factor SigI [Bacillus sp. BRMEA1]|nr:RNA polymerase sigma factor SigI [Neobacillus endophyticus]